MRFTLILENETGEQINMTTTANQYMTSEIDGLYPPAGTISTSTYAGMDGSYLNNAFIEKRNLVISFQMRVLDMLTAEQLALLGDLQQFEDSTKYDIQTIRESVEPVISQAHWHHNLTLLNSLTSAKVAKWDKISDVETELQRFQDSTQYDQQNQNDAIQIL